MHRKEKCGKESQGIAAEQLAAYQVHEPNRNAVQEDTEEVIADRRIAEELIADQEGYVGEWAIEVRDSLLALLAEERGAEKFAYIAKTMDVRITFDLGVVVVDEPAEETIGIEKETQQEEHAEEMIPCLRGESAPPIHARLHDDA